MVSCGVAGDPGSSEDTGRLKEMATRLGEEGFHLEQRKKQAGKEIETLEREMMALEKEKVPSAVLPPYGWFMLYIAWFHVLVYSYIHILNEYMIYII